MPSGAGSTRGEPAAVRAGAEGAGFGIEDGLGALGEGAHWGHLTTEGARGELYRLPPLAACAEKLRVIPGFGKQNLTVGSLPTCDIVLAGRGGPARARADRPPRRRQARSSCAAPASPTPTAARSAPASRRPSTCAPQFTVGAGQVPVPLHHPAITLALMATGMLAAPPGQIIIGRDPSRASIVIQHPSVSSQHATVIVDRMMVIDHSSTSGTYVGTTRIPAGTPTPIEAGAILAFGPVPVQVQLLVRLAQAPRPALGSSAIMMLRRPPAGGAQLPAVPAPQAPRPPQSRRRSARPRRPQCAGRHRRAHGPDAAARRRRAGAALAPPRPRRSRARPGRRTRPSSASSTSRAATRHVKSIGRTPDNDIVIAHPQVLEHAHAFLHSRASSSSSRTAAARTAPSSAASASPPGQRVAGRERREGLHRPDAAADRAERRAARADVVQEEYAADAGRASRSTRSRRGTCSSRCPTATTRREMKVLLDHVTFKALPGRHDRAHGPLGRRQDDAAPRAQRLPAARRAGRSASTARTSTPSTTPSAACIGYVPQDDIVHPELTVFEAVKYSAQFRLPPDYSRGRDRPPRRADASRTSASSGVKNLQIGKPEKKVLSGGQRKRVNIALELVTDPVILFLDEPTSGLAADDTTALINLLADLTKKTGKTIIMTIHQPAKDEFEKFNLCLVMGYGGVPMYFGPTARTRTASSGRGRSGSGSRTTSTTRATCSTCSTCASGPSSTRCARTNPTRSAATRAGSRPPASGARSTSSPTTPSSSRCTRAGARSAPGQGQRGLPGDARDDERAARPAAVALLARSRCATVGGTAIMLLQAPIIGVLLAVVFGGQKAAVPAWCLGALQELRASATRRRARRRPARTGWQPTTDHTAAIFFLVVAAVWFGTSNAAREIVTRAGHLPARADGEPRPLQLRAVEVPAPRALLRRPVRDAPRHRLLRARLPRRPATRSA